MLPHELSKGPRVWSLASAFCPDRESDDQRLMSNDIFVAGEKTGRFLGSHATRFCRGMAQGFPCIHELGPLAHRLIVCSELGPRAARVDGHGVIDGLSDEPVPFREVDRG